MKKSDLSELKGLSKPPQMVKDYFTVIRLLFGFNSKQAADFKKSVEFVATTDPSITSRINEFDVDVRYRDKIYNLVA
jgi:hypothetical protein